MYKCFPYRMALLFLLLLFNLPAYSQADSDVERNWWRQFSDPLLDSLIRQGIDHNYDLKTAMQRMAIARAAMNQAKAGYYPTLDFSAGWTAERSSGATSAGNPISTPTERYFNAGLNASWEIDIFGKVTADVKAKQASYRASQAEYAGTMVSISAQIASTYFTLRGQQRLLQVAKAHCASQLKIVDIAKARYEAQLASKLDVAQAYQTYYTTAATIPSLENSVTTSINALGLLIGDFPVEAKAMLAEPGPLPNWISTITSEIPADFLRQRPDIAQAEQNLAAAAAGLSSAKKDYLPSLKIEGSVGSSARKISNMFSSKSFDWEVGPTLSWTIFNGFARKYGIVSARETLQNAVDNYNHTVLNAVCEVENDISTYSSILRQIELLQQLCAQNEEALRLSIERYKDSLAPMTDVVNAQVSALSGESQLIQAQASALNALITLYEALGGGVPLNY